MLDVSLRAGVLALPAATIRYLLSARVVTGEPLVLNQVPLATHVRRLTPRFNSK
jgi:hypothetical protein